jgi:subtilisin family serine protease
MLLTGALLLSACGDEARTPLSPDAGALLAKAEGTQHGGINVVLNTPATDAILADLGRYGIVTDRLDEINAVFVNAAADQLAAIRARPYVKAAGPNQVRTIGPVSTVSVTDVNFTAGLSMWNLDAVNVTAGPGFNTRAVAQTGEGVFVGVLDTGLGSGWERYFPADRIAAQYATAFVGGPEFGNGAVVEAPNKWQHDTHWHGTHVTSTIIGFSLNGTPVTGVAPKAKVIPVKVLHNSGFGWSSMIAHGILYIANLKAGPLAGSPVVINMSLGGPSLDVVEKAAIDFAISKGVIIVASAGNSGDRGMSFPGAYAPVISAASAGWTGQWLGGADNNPGNWWWADNVVDPTNVGHFYISDFSSRALKGQDLDVTAPGDWVVGPFQLDNSVHTSFFFLSGTSMASPHVAGIVALMAQKKPSLTADQAESILEATAIRMGAGSRTVTFPGGATETIAWGSNATGHGFVTASAALAKLR